MRKFILTPLIAILLSFGLTFNLTAQDLMITGVVDGDLSGGLPKAIELYVVNDIADLSVYGIDIASNGNPSAGAPGYNFPADAVTAGSFLYLASSTTEFNTWFGFDPDYTDGSVSINGDDAVELYSGTTVIDVYGAVGTDGTGMAWEYTDGWGYRVDDALPSATFTEADWTFANGALDTYSDNASAANPFPNGTYAMGGGGLTLPFYETFETWPLANWTVTGTSEVWESDDGTTYGPGSVTEGTLAAMFDVYNAPSGDTTIMTTDVIDMDGAVNPTLSFDYWMGGWSADVNLWLKVEMTTDGSTWNEIFYHEYDGNEGWNSESLLLTGITATTQIRITGASDFGSDNLFVDNLAIEEITCLAPTDLTLDANTTTEATLSWTENGTATNWNVIYGAPGFDPTTAGTTEVAGAIPYTITGLTDGTSYDVYVQTDCGSGDLSTMAGPLNFTTDADCSAITTFPYLEDFDGDWTTWCWTIRNNDGDSYTWEQDDAYITPHSGAWTAHGTGNNDDYLISPEISVNSANLFVEWWDVVESASYNNTYDVLVSTTDTAIASFTDNLGTFDCTNTDWTKHQLSLGAYDGQNIYIAFYQTYSDATYYGFGIDDFQLLEINCPAPTDLALDAITTTEATFSWTENGSATSWNVIYGAPGFDPTTEGTTEVAGAIPYTITGLTEATEYDVYVQPDCGTDLSSMDGPVNFTTECNTFVAPFTEDFENAGAIPTCWSQGASNAEDWEFTDAPGDEHIGDNGTITGATPSGGYMAWVDDSSPHEVGTELLSPMIDISALTTPELSFYLISNNEGETNVDFSVDVWDGAAWNNDVFFNDTNTVDGGWEYITVDLSTLTITGPIQLRFVVDENNGTDYDDDVAIDDVSVKEAPSCFMVSDLAVVSTTQTEATLTWTENSGATTWNIVYGAPGFDPTSEGTLVVADAIPYTITGLDASTEYDVYVQADCGGGDLSDFAPPVTVLTECGVIPAPYFEDFESGETPLCWINESYDEQWEFGTSAGHGPDADHTTGSGIYAWVDDSTPNSDTISMLTPEIDVTSLTTPALYFWLFSDDEGSGINMTLSIDVWDGSAWNDDVAVYSGNTNGWEERIIDLSAYAGGTIQIRFRADETLNGDDFYDDIAIDDVSIDEAPSCYTPIELVVESYTDTEATLSWTEPGSATNWNIIYGAPGFDPTTEGTTVAANTIPYTITGLTAETDYDVYIQSDCGSGDLSSLTGPVAFTTASACPMPTDLVLTGIDSDIAQIDWTAYGQTEWYVKLSTTSIDPTTVDGDIIANELTTTKPYNISGLTSNTTYYFYIQSSCGSAWSSEFVFTTECETYLVPFLEEFNSFIPDCWSESQSLLSDPIDLSGSTSSAWAGDDFANNTSNSQAARVNIYGTSRDDWMISPALDLGDGSTAYQLEFDLALTDYYNNAPAEMDGDDDVFAVVISTDGGSTWTEANTLRRWDNAGSSYVYNDIPTNGEHVIIDLTGYTNEVKIAFYGESTVSNADNDLFVDNVEVIEIPSCAGPTAIQANSVTSTEATISWTENGTASMWNIIYGETGFDPLTEGTTEMADAIPYTLTGLTAGTVYDVYVQADCGSSELSDLEGPVTFTTELCPAADQCDFGFDLFDSYGDGWNGSYISIMQGGVEVGQIGMTGGETDTVYQALCEGFITDLVWHSGSTFDYEVEFTIYDPYSNELLFMDSADTITDGSVFFSFTPTCTEPVTDLALIEPSSGIDCELTASEVIPVQFDNVGETTIASGEIVNFTVTSEGTPMIDEDITLSEDLLPGESWSGTTTGTVDLSAIGTYNWTAAITYAADMNADNDTLEGYIVNFDQEIQFQDAVNDTINVSEYPYTIQPDVVYTPDSASLSPDYLWGDGETLSMLQVNADGWYYLTVTTEGCSVEDSVFVRLNVGMDAFDNSSLAVYPNPNEGQFAVSMTLAERQDVVLTIVSSSGQVVREIKLDDVTSISEDINIEGMADGLYNLRINAGDKQYNRKIVVQ